MEDAAVVPQDHVAFPPVVGIGKPVLDGKGPQFFEQIVAFREGHAFDLPPDIAARIKGRAPRFRVSPHQRVDHFRQFGRLVLA